MIVQLIVPVKRVQGFPAGSLRREFDFIHNVVPQPHDMIRVPGAELTVQRRLFVGGCIYLICGIASSIVGGALMSNDREGIGVLTAHGWIDTPNNY